MTFLRRERLPTNTEEVREGDGCKAWFEQVIRNLLYANTMWLANLNLNGTEHLVRSFVRASGQKRLLISPQKVLFGGLQADRLAIGKDGKRSYVNDAPLPQATKIRLLAALRTLYGDENRRVFCLYHRPWRAGVT